MKNGGKRKGAGGKKGQIKPHFNSFWSQREIKDYMKWVKKNYKKDVQLAKWAGDHIFGKAVQPLENSDGSPLILRFDNAFTSRPTSNSKK